MILYKFPYRFSEVVKIAKWAKKLWKQLLTQEDSVCFLKGKLVRL